MKQYRNLSSTMETETILKNEASLKSQMSKGNRYSLAICFCLLFFGTFSICAQDTKLRVAILDVYCTQDYSSSISAALEITSNLTTELVNTNKYRVVERSRIVQVLREQGFQSNQDVSARAVELGQLLGVRKIITGEFSGANHTTSIRLIDVESGDIEAAITIKNNFAYKRKSGFYTLDCQAVAKKLLKELLK